MATDDSVEESRDAARERPFAARLKSWFLLEADRWAVAAGLLVSIFSTLVVLAWIDPSPLRDTMQRKDPLETLFQALVSSIIAGVTIVVTINQLVLSQELGAVGDQQSRMAGSLSFRDEVGRVLDIDDVPPDPAIFLRALVDGSGALAVEVSRSIEGESSAIADEIDRYAAGVIENAEEVSDQLEGAQFGTFAVLLAALRFNYSRKLYWARRFRRRRGGRLDEEVRSAVDRLIHVLELFGSAREHIKTLYFQWELINLSRAILYASVPSIVIAVSATVFVDVNVISGTMLGVDRLAWLVAAMTTVALAPFIILLAYVLRIATVAKRTLAIGPFILGNGGQADDIETSSHSWL